MKILRRTMLALALIAIASMVIVSVYVKSTRTAEAEEDTVDLDSLTDEEVEQIKLDLTVNMDAATLANMFPDVSWEWLDNSMPNRAEERIQAAGFSDAVSFPFKGKQDDGKYTKDELKSLYGEVIEEILRNPVYCDMVIRGLKDLEVVKGSTLGSMNPWMDEFVSATDAAMAKDTNDHPAGMEIWVCYKANDAGTDYLYNEDGTKKVFVTEDYRLYAVKVCILLQRMYIKGVLSPKSVDNYCLNWTADACRTRTLAADYQENKPALVLAYTTKNDSNVIFIGFNMLDKRFERFDKISTPAPVTIKPPKKIPPTTPTPTPDNTPNPTPTPDNTPNPTPTPDNTPDETPNPTPTPDSGNKKDPSDDPVNNNNAPTGGGQNLPTDGPGEFQPEDPVKDSSQGHQDPATVTPKTPDPGQTDPARANEKVDKTDEHKQSDQPDDQTQDTTWKDQTDPNHVEHGQDGADGTGAVDDEAPTGGNGSLGEPQ